MPGKPSTPKMTTCEANIGGTWRTITAEQAIPTNKTRRSMR